MTSNTVTVIFTVDYKTKEYLTTWGSVLPVLESPCHGEELEVRVSLLDLLTFEGSEGDREAKSHQENKAYNALVQSHHKRRNRRSRLIVRHANTGNLSVSVRSFRVKNTGAFLFVLDESNQQ